MMEPTQNRLIAAVFFAASTGVLLLALWMTPSAKGMGTHQQMGLPPCGFKLATNLPCISCGMTTSFAHTADGDVVSGFLTQPAGMLLALGCALLSVVSFWSLVSGMSLAPLGRMLARPAAIVVMIATLLASWAYTLTLAFLHGPH